MRSGTEIQTLKATKEYEEKKNEGEKEHSDEGAKISKAPEVKMEEKAKLKAPPIQPYEPPAPYPERLKKKEHDQQFSKFLERFKTSTSTCRWWNF